MEVAIALAAVAIVSLSNIEVSRLMFPAVAQIAMICGPVASMWFVWRDRILFAHWLVRRWVWARKAWIMFVAEFVLYSIADMFIAGVIVLMLLVLIRR